MSNWQKSFLGGLIIGSFGVVPLLFWLAEIRVKFRCPDCGKEIVAWKGNKQIIPQLEAQSRESEEGTDDEETEDSTDLSIATAPTV